MSFADRLIHSVAIARPTSGTVDDYNQPSQTYTTVATVACNIQPKSGRERAQLNEQGAVRAEYRVFMGPATAPIEGDHLIRQTPAEVYEITFVAPRWGATLHHYELDCTRVWP